MGLINNTKFMPLLQAFVLVLHCFLLEFCSSSDTITSAKFITDPDTIVSNGNMFKLGFFSPVNSTNRYIGIMYNVSATTPVWIANRDKPLNDSRGSVTISEDGDLVVLNGQKEIIWSSNLSSSMAKNSSAQLLDTGNLVLKDSSNGNTLWESFDDPSDSFLQNMRIDRKNLLTSWKSPSDPSIGSFSAGLDDPNVPQFFIWNGSNQRWRTGPWDGHKFIGVPTMDDIYIDGFKVVENKEGTSSLTFTYTDKRIHYVLSAEGILMEKHWSDLEQNWKVEWRAPDDDCDVYGKCGPFGGCDARDSPICMCLKGFEPKNMEEWNKGNWTAGCVRRTELQCNIKNTNNGSENKGKKDGFLKLTKVKVPDLGDWMYAPDDCENRCLNNCSCIAYAYYPGIGCMQWTGGLIDIKKFSSRAGADLYIRVAHSELDKKRNMNVVIAIAVIIGSSVIIAICSYFCWKRMANKRGMKPESDISLCEREETYLQNSSACISGEHINKVKLEELPLFNFEKLANATENFHSANKLGEGGFGPVYKGKLSDGREIAVKRLSRSSGQGLEEFMNEVVVISKLQHRNLVKLLGCCVEGEEKMLIYEYMPNGSLDALLFIKKDAPSVTAKQEHLDWSRRVNIIEGIGRGLMYLHRDSRLRIIHRDLKASNILLDEELNPKISDFGMARIFGGKQDQADTRRVVGTYGYMAPEYAMEGIFSEKSDVFSFGVLLLEIITGKKNNRFYHDDRAISLLGFAWTLWNDDKEVVKLIDPRISDQCFQKEILRYIHVGLLCVQDLPKDRPSVSSVLSMLSSDIVDLPTPKEPAFTERHFASETGSSQQTFEKYSVDNVTLTVVEGR